MGFQEFRFPGRTFYDDDLNLPSPQVDALGVRSVNILDTVGSPSHEPFGPEHGSLRGEGWDQDVEVGRVRSIG